jgi:hypothetical protein
MFGNIVTVRKSDGVGWEQVQLNRPHQSETFKRTIIVLLTDDAILVMTLTLHARFRIFSSFTFNILTHPSCRVYCSLNSHLPPGPLFMPHHLDHSRFMKAFVRGFLLNDCGDIGSADSLRSRLMPFSTIIEANQPMLRVKPDLSLAQRRVW